MGGGGGVSENDLCLDDKLTLHISLCPCLQCKRGTS